MLNYEKEFKGRTVFITGADGFIGSTLTEKLVEYGAEVIVFIRATSSGELHNIPHLKDKIKVHRGNLIDKDSIKVVLKDLKNKSAIIFHLAAQAHVGESWERPYETFMVNTFGTLNLLQSIKELNLNLFKFSIAGTSEEYGNINKDKEKFYDFDDEKRVILRERSPLNPQSIYATSKVAADFLTMNYFDGYRIPTVVTRMFNNYGPRQNPRYITGTVITQALSRDEIKLGFLEPMRDFCYVEDGVAGHMAVALKGKPGEVYCYGYGKNISIRDWVNLILRTGRKSGYWKEKKIVSESRRFRPGKSDVMALRVGYEKLNKETGWRPLISWEEGIRRTIDWYAKNKDRWLGRVDWR